MVGNAGIGIGPILDAVVAALPPRAAHLGSVAPAVRRRGDPAPLLQDYPRVMVGISGEHRYLYGRGGERREVALAPGVALHLPPDAWAVPARRAATRFLAVVFRATHLRVLVAEYGAGLGRPAIQWHHTRRPLAGPATHILRALADQAERPADAALEGELIAALLRLARAHLAADGIADERPSATHARAARELMRTAFAEPLTRDDIARALGVHPTYLSQLWRRETGTTLREALLGVRVEHAHGLLRATRLPLAQIARRCGFVDASHFARAFRRATGGTPGSARRGR
ncbi:MAG TPA: helix-turn-helix transcriptional regulator [Planctomycetota bacterium]|nr:helix-turn-helix transcriptional regulator [Planctomycetota bacterium]